MAKEPIEPAMAAPAATGGLVAVAVPLLDLLALVETGATLVVAAAVVAAEVVATAEVVAAGTEEEETAAGEVDAAALVAGALALSVATWAQSSPTTFRVSSASEVEQLLRTQGVAAV